VHLASRISSKRYLNS